MDLQELEHSIENFYVFGWRMLFAMTNRIKLENRKTELTFVKKRFPKFSKYLQKKILMRSGREDGYK